MKSPVHLTTEEGITRLKNFLRRIRRYAIVMAIVAIIGGYGFNRYYTPRHLNILQRMYLPQYEETVVERYLPFIKWNYPTLIATSNDITKLDFYETPYTTDENIEAISDDEGGHMKLNKSGLPIFRLKRVTDDKVPIFAMRSSSGEDRYKWLRWQIYDGRTLLDIWKPAIGFGIVIFLFGLSLCALADNITNRQYLAGKSIRGTRLVSLERYVREHRNTQGYKIKAHNPDINVWLAKLRGLAGLSAVYFILTVPRKEETEGLLILGDPGTGKTQIMHQVLYEIGRRKPMEAIVVYDPEGEFFMNHGDPQRDYIMNPTDDRCPYWSPASEISYQNQITEAADRKMLAECFLPYRRFSGTNSDFFIDAARMILARVFEVEKDVTRICETLASENLIDEVVAGTEMAHLINPGAKGQRGGVLATLAEVAEMLRLLPRRDQCMKELSFTQFAKTRQSRIFFTSKHDTRDALGKLYAALINLSMKRLLASDLEWSKQHPCWLIIDEVHALKHLSALPTVIVEGRKHGLKIVIGTQNKAQLQEHYGPAAATMLASFHTKIFFRCNEPESARWVSDLIGELETEKPRMGTTASVQQYGRDSIQYTTMTEQRSVVSKEEIMSLPNLQGYWKYENLVVRFRIRPLIFRNPNKPFIERRVPPPMASAVRQMCAPSNNGKQSNEILPEDLGDLDLKF